MAGGHYRVLNDGMCGGDQIAAVSSTGNTTLGLPGGAQTAVLQVALHGHSNIYGAQNNLNSQDCSNSAPHCDTC